MVWITLGAAVVVLALIDVFYTVLFPGSGHGPMRRPLARSLRWVFRQSSRLSPAMRRRVLPYAGPVEVTATLLSWFVLLLVGWATIYLPGLGEGVKAATGPTDSSWWTALYFSGYDLTTLGLGDLVATTPGYRVAVVVEAATGFMVFTLAISYFISVYGTLTGRNTFAMALHDRSGGTGRGSKIVCALWHEGPVSASLHLASIAGGLRELVQTHSSYPVLRSFHYQQEYDALPRMLLTCWETATLLRTSLDVPEVATTPDGSAGGSRGGRPELTGGALTEIEAAATTMTLRLLGTNPVENASPRPDQLVRWRRHHAEMLAELRAAGVPVRADSADDYLDARSRWDVGLARLAEQLMYEWPDELRPTPGTADRR